MGGNVNPASCQQTADNQDLLLIVKGTISVMKYNNVEENTFFCLQQTAFFVYNKQLLRKASANSFWNGIRFALCLCPFFFWWSVNRLLKVEVDAPFYSSDASAHSTFKDTITALPAETPANSTCIADLSTVPKPFAGWLSY